MTGSPTTLRPLYRPFVIRPAIWTGLFSVFLLLAYFGVWETAYLMLGEAAWAGPLLILLLPIAVLAARVVAYRKTDYAIFSDRIVVHVGGILGDRTVELKLLNITQVEWQSPFLLKFFYGVGHIIISEAGNAEQNARFSCIENPEEIYRLIAKNMREQGFSMQRNARVAREKSGLLGALVDMLGVGAGLIYSAFLLTETLGPIVALITTKAGRGVAMAIEGSVGAASESISSSGIAWVVGLLGVLAVGGVILGALAFFGAKFIELTRRTYILYDDVVDSYSGFLSETRKFIPLENLTDTQLLRPIHKRILGLSDLRISARGAGTDMLFQSMPRAEEFARALEGRMDAIEPIDADPGAPAPLEDGQPAPAGQALAAPDSRPIRTYTFQPEPLRAAAAILLRLASLPLMAIGGLGVFVATNASDIPLDAATLGIGLSGVLGIAAFAVIAGVVFATARAVIVANATEYSFDARRARKTFDFMNRTETKFTVDKITSLTISRNPIDRMLGTYTIKLRSIGSAETLDFTHIAVDDARLDALQEALGLDAPAEERPRRTALRPVFTLWAGVRANLGGYGFLLAATVVATAVCVYFDQVALALWLWMGVLVLGLPSVFLWQSLQASQIRANLSEAAISVQGGIFMRYHHMAPYRHIKGVASVGYPGGADGLLSVTTGGGFSMSIPFLPDISTRHDQLDGRLLHDPSRPKNPGAIAEEAAVVFQPNPLSEATRHAGTCVFTIVLIPALPVVIPWVIWRSRRTAYRVESTRLHVEKSFLYHRRTTVLFDRIDHLESSRNLLNQLFKNRNIEVYTVGSPTVDLVLHGVNAHERALGVIRDRMTNSTQVARAPAASA